MIYIIKFIITGNPVSSKNSRPIFVNKATGSRFVGKSDKLKGYINNGLEELKKYIHFYNHPELTTGVLTDDNKLIPIPILDLCEISFHFYVKDNRNYDLVNLMQCPLDLLTQANIITDDNYKIVYSLDGSRIFIDKDNPRTEIIINMEDKQ